MDGAGSGDVGFGGWNREELDLGNGVFIAAFCAVGEEIVE